MSAQQRTHRDAGRHQSVGIHDGCQLMQQVRRLLKQLGCIPLHHVFQQLGFWARHSVPCLRLTPDNITPLLQQPTNIHTQVPNITLSFNCRHRNQSQQTATQPRCSLLCCCTVSTEQITNGAETAAIDGLVSSWSENIFISFCLRASRYGLTLWCALSLLAGGAIQVLQLQLQLHKQHLLSETHFL